VYNCPVFDDLKDQTKNLCIDQLRRALVLGINHDNPIGITVTQVLLPESSPSLAGACYSLQEGFGLASSKKGYLRSSN